MSAADAGGVSAPSALGDVSLFGGFDAPVDLLPGLVVVGVEVWFADVVTRWVHGGVQIVSELSASERRGQRLAGFEACSPGDGGLVDPVPSDGLGKDVHCLFVVGGDDVGVVGVPASG